MNSPHEFMARAIRLARRALYTTDPNPRVGCVIVRDGQIVGEGYHARAGEPHAEIHALQQAGDQARGATAYVTLEPCNHTGRTGPCSEALITAGVARVVAAMKDPNPQVAGAGLKRLQAAGIETDCGLLEAEARSLNPGFIQRMTTGRPYVRLKLAMSLDGRTAAADGSSQWITSPQARLDVQRLRARSSAIVFAAGTVLADDPSMTVRVEDWQEPYPLPVRQPLRVLLDRRAQVSPSARLFAQPGPVLWLSGKPLPACQNAVASVEQVVMEDDRGSLPLPQVLQQLAGREINEVLVESGPRLAGAFLEAGLVDELVIYQAPTMLGHKGMPLAVLDQINSIRDKQDFTITDIRRIGQDIRLTCLPASSKQ